MKYISVPQYSEIVQELHQFKGVLAILQNIVGSINFLFDNVVENILVYETASLVKLATKRVLVML